MKTAVITGIGAASPNGLGAERYWSASLNAVGGIDRITRFDPSSYPVSLAGEINDFVAGEHVPNRLLRQTDRMTQLAMAVGDWALRDSALELTAASDLDMGVVTACTAGGGEFGQRELQKLWKEGWRSVSAYMAFAWFYAVNTGQIAIRNGLRGAAASIVTDHAGGLDAIGHARRQVRKGDTSVVVTGAMDSAMCPIGLVMQMPGDRLSTRQDPQSAYLPFDADASGYVTGEGGALLVLEEAAAARERGAPRVYGEVAGYAATFDPRPGTGRQPGLHRAMELALEDADLTPDEVDVVFADGAGIPELDEIEAQALSKVFGPYGIPVTVPKTMTGRLNAGSAALDVVTALLAMRDGWIPPTINVRQACPAYALDLVTGEARPARLRAAMVLARGVGGFNAAVVLRAPS